MIWPIVENFGSRPITAGLVTLSAPDAANNPENIGRALAWLDSKQVRVKWSANARAEGVYLAAPAAALAADLHAMIADSSVDLIITTGGGTNANELLPHLKPEILTNSPKPIIGLSNSTVVLNALSCASGIVTFHGPVLVWNLGSESGIDDYTASHMFRALHGSPLRIMPEPSWQWLKPGKASGRAWGGNLWSFQQLVGTPFLPDMNGAVLCIEECFTELHNVQAGLVHLRTAGLLQGLSALVAGVPLECDETEMPDGRTFEDIVTGVCEGLDFPILAGVNLGHTDRKITIPLGATAHLDSTKNHLAFEI